MNNNTSIISNNSPAFTVVICNYNNANFIAQAIKSVLKQQFTDFELIIIDDCSTDNSLDIIKQYADPRISLYINDNNSEISLSRNRGIELAKGKYILFIDSDDYISEDYLAKAYLAFIETDVSSVIMPIHSYIEADQIFCHDTSYIYINSLPQGYLEINESNIRDIPTTNGGKIYRLDCIKQYNLRFPPHTRFEDFVFFFIFYCHFKNSYLVKEAFYVYRINSNSFMQRSIKGEVDFSDIYLVLYKVYDYLNANQLFEQFRHPFCSFVQLHISMYYRYESLRDKVYEYCYDLFKYINFPNGYEDCIHYLELLNFYNGVNLVKQLQENHVKPEID